MTNPEALALQEPSIDEASWGFQIQQVVEKALKAWLFQLGDDPPLIHSATTPIPSRWGWSAPSGWFAPSGWLNT